MINKFEAVGIFVCIGIMSLALFLMRVDLSTQLGNEDSNTQTASVVASTDEKELVNTVVNSMNAVGDLTNIIVDDVVLGEGDEVAKGDTVTVHYIGTLQNGQQFDNSYVKGTPFSFTVGEGKVIKGWEEGLINMKEGGQRILVIPPEFAYGSKSVGQIPANATLVFAVELLEINK